MSCRALLLPLPVLPATRKNANVGHWPMAAMYAPERQQEITRAAIRSFFDAYLKKDVDALARLRGMNKQFGEVAVVYQD